MTDVVIEFQVLILKLRVTMSMSIVDIEKLRQIAETAGEKILPIYQAASFSITMKNDRSPLTEADLASHHFIYENLQREYPHIPIISEESHTQFTFTERKKFSYFFLVDPLDGTKEFIKKNGEFTVNIALIHKNRAVAGVIHAPVLGISYYAEEGKGAFKYFQNHPIALQKTVAKNNKISALVSRSHIDENTEIFLQSLRNEGKEIEKISIGSALKFGLVAEGKADIYPRFSPSMEWDTAAGHILIQEVGKTLFVADTKLPLLYNKKSLLNPGFLVV